MRIESSTTGWSQDNAVEVWHGSQRLDDKGREIGYIVGFNAHQDGRQFAVWVQKGRRKITGLCEFSDHGPRQRATYFDNEKEAWAHARAVLADRLSKLQGAQS